MKYWIFISSFKVSFLFLIFFKTLLNLLSKYFVQKVKVLVTEIVSLIYHLDLWALSITEKKNVLKEMIVTVHTAPSNTMPSIWVLKRIGRLSWDLRFTHLWCISVFRIA